MFDYTYGWGHLLQKYFLIYYFRWQTNYHLIIFPVWTFCNIHYWLSNLLLHVTGKLSSYPFSCMTFLLLGQIHTIDMLNVLFSSACLELQNTSPQYFQSYSAFTDNSLTWLVYQTSRLGYANWSTTHGQLIDTAFISPLRYLTIYKPANFTHSAVLSCFPVDIDSKYSVVRACVLRVNVGQIRVKD